MNKMKRPGLGFQDAPQSLTEATVSALGDTVDAFGTALPESDQPESSSSPKRAKVDNSVEATDEEKEAAKLSLAKEQALLALKEVTQLPRVPRDENKTLVDIPHIAAGHVIGKKGANIRKISEESGANVQLNDKPNVDNPKMKRITLTGSATAREEAYEMLRSCLDEYAKRNSQDIVDVHTIEFPDQARTRAPPPAQSVSGLQMSIGRAQPVATARHLAGLARTQMLSVPMAQAGLQQMVGMGGVRQVLLQQPTQLGQQLRPTVAQQALYRPPAALSMSRTTIPGFTRGF
jgi:hypothetical protein